jgi:CDP-diacylglycerol--serine O-phosphatidyltransferase
MIRSLHLADVFTLGNMFCGTGAVLSAVGFARTGGTAHLYAAVALVALAAVVDFLDGRVARMRGTASALGQQMDSLADLVSFGVAPAAIAYAMGLDGPLDVAALCFFAACGLARLARYNVTAAALAARSGEAAPKVAYYEGTPITFGFLPLAAALVAHHMGAIAAAPRAPLHLVTLLFVVSGCFMISKTLRVPKP